MDLHPNTRRVETKIKLLVVLGDGGHTAEIVRLVELLGPAYEYTYLMTTADQISRSKITVEGPVHYITRPRAKAEKLWGVAWHLAYNLWQAVWLLYRIRPRAVLGSGPAVMVPVALLNKLAGGKIIFVETGSRITELSLTGKIMLKIADLYFVQWEQLQQRYPQTIFAGRLL
jgi:UDP-N-acetylglucosamine:LPS N-acetylglucosamine transferase